MKKSSVIEKIREGLYKEGMEYVEKLASVRKDSVAKLKKANVEEGTAILCDLLADVNSVVAAPNVEGVALPGFISKVQVRGEKSVTNFTLIVRSKQSATIKVKKEFDISVGENMITEMGKSMLSALMIMLDYVLAEENVFALNEKITEIFEAEGLQANFAFAVSADDSPIISITDKMVVFKANIAAAFAISELGIFSGGDEYYDIIGNGAKKALIDAFKTCPTTVSLIKGKVDVIDAVAGLKTKKRASKLIRMAYHRKAENLKAVKTGVGYYEGEHKGAEIFALIEKNEAGKLEVVLSPFDIETNLNVEGVDVLKAI